MQKVPPSGSANPEELYIGRNLGTGVAGSRVPPKFFNMVNSELSAIVDGAGLARDDANWAQVLKAFRMLRLREQRVAVPSGGVTITAADESVTFFLDLAVRQTMTVPNPATVPVGFTVIIETVGLPSGFQTASISVAAGVGATAIRFKGSDHTPFYLIGQGEIFQLVSDGTRYRAYTIGHPSSLGEYRNATGLSSPQSFATSWAVPLMTTRSGSTAQFGGWGTSANNASIIVPVSGLYQLSGSFQGASNATGTFRQTEIALTAAQSPASPGDYYDQGMIVADATQSGLAKSISTQFLKQGSPIWILGRNSNAGGVYLPNTANFSVFLLTR